jgi:hypothetical protein
VEPLSYSAIIIIFNKIIQMNDFIKHAQASLSAAEVIARRMPTLWMMPFMPTWGAQAELVRMIAEKQAAAAEGMMSASFAAAMQGQRLWVKAMTGTLKAGDMAEAHHRVQRAAIAPAGKRLKANVKRLRKG